MTDADIDRIADAVPVDQIGVHITTWHRRFARAVLAAAPQPKPIAYGMPRADGLILDVITPEEHESYSGEYTVPLYATPPAAPAEPCYCDRMGIGVPGVSCGDCPRDYKPAAPAPAVPLTDEQFADIVAEASLAVDLAANPLKLLAFARAVLSAAPVVREPLPREQQIAIREAHCNTASDEYFGARPQIEDVPRRRIYEAGFKEGWESGIGGGGK